jgi:hypothetical protein
MKPTTLAVLVVGWPAHVYHGSSALGQSGANASSMST